MNTSDHPYSDNELYIDQDELRDEVLPLNSNIKLNNEDKTSSFYTASAGRKSGDKDSSEYLSAMNFGSDENQLHKLSNSSMEFKDAFSYSPLKQN